MDQNLCSRHSRIACVSVCIAIFLAVLTGVLSCNGGVRDYSNTSSIFRSSSVDRCSSNSARRDCDMESVHNGNTWLWELPVTEWCSMPTVPQGQVTAHWPDAVDELFWTNFQSGKFDLQSGGQGHSTRVERRVKGELEKYFELSSVRIVSEKMNILLVQVKTNFHSKIKLDDQHREMLISHNGMLGNDMIEIEDGMYIITFICPDI